MTSPAGGPFHIVCPSAQLRRVERWLRDAAVGGPRERLLSTVRTVHDRLARDPETWGDPQYRLPFSGMVMYHRLLIPLQVFYAVDPGRRLVFVKAFLRCQPPDGGP
jgi:hypothetical protein